MSEYGHQYASGKGFHLDGWSAGPYILVAGGKRFYFEDSARFGPVPIDSRTGDPIDALPCFPERSPFWSVWRRWVEEGRRTIEGKQPRSGREGWLHCVVSNGRRKDSDDADI